MGSEKRARLSATRRFVSEYPTCCFCAGLRQAVTREHMPPLSMFDGRRRPDKLVMPSCDECNRLTSTADLTASIVSGWNFETNDTELKDHHRLVARLRKQAPEILAEWTDPAGFVFTSSRGRRHLRKQGVSVPLEAEVVTIGPHTIRQLNIFSRKVALALYFEHFRRPLKAPLVYSSIWHTKEDFHEGPPSDLLKLLPVYATLQQGAWSTADTFGYRFNINLEEHLFGFSAHLRRGLFVSGFVVPSVHIPPAENDWFEPGDLVEILSSPDLAKRCEGRP